MMSRMYIEDCPHKLSGAHHWKAGHFNCDASAATPSRLSPYLLANESTQSVCKGSFRPFTGEYLK